MVVVVGGGCCLQRKFVGYNFLCVEKEEENGKNKQITFR